MKIFLSAGEASGEHYGELLIEALRRRDPGAAFFGLGGERMGQAGCELVVNSSAVAHMGITEVLAHVPSVYRNYWKLVTSIQARRPDAGVLIDFPDVNLRLAAQLHKRGIPCIYFVSPQLWAWKQWRIWRVRKYVDRMLVIFPFEEDFYRKHGIDAEYVGHPLAEANGPETSREDFGRAHKLDPQKPWIALLPGSRRNEVALNLPIMAEAAVRLGNNYEFLLPVASTLDRSWVQEQLPASAGGRITLVDNARTTLAVSRCAAVASGTATVEAALAGIPFVVVYKLSSISYAVASRAVKLPHAGMVNLIAGREIVPELIQDRFTAANLVRHIEALLTDDRLREAMMANLREVGARLRLNAPETVMERVADTVSKLALGAQDSACARGKNVQTENC